MQHLIIGYGYCGYYLAQYLLSQQQTVIAVSRHLTDDLRLPGLIHLAQGVETPLVLPAQPTIVYYLIPPLAKEGQDSLLAQFLAQLLIKPVKMVYFGSSGVYGNHHGAWVDEQATCYIEYARQQRRLQAEQQWLNYGQQQGIPAVILRIAGIYGANRLPIMAAHQQTPLIHPEEAPYTNHIYVRDLVNIAAQLAQTITGKMIYNIADGMPNRMGFLQQQVAELLGLPPAPYQPFATVWQTASTMKQEFMHASKRLSIAALTNDLQQGLTLTPLKQAILQSL